jgi:hypothetical protein
MLMRRPGTEPTTLSPAICGRPSLTRELSDRVTRIRAGFISDTTCAGLSSCGSQRTHPTRASDIIAHAIGRLSARDF